MLSKAVASLVPSATLEITARAKQMATAGEPVISLAAGQPDFDTPKEIKDAAIKALEDGFTKYTPTSGIPELKEAICKKLKKDNSLFYEPAQIVVGNGGKQVLQEAIFCLSQEGDEVLIPAPYWVSYPEMVRLSGAKPVFIQTGKDFKVTPALLRESISGRTKVFILNAPSNPTGVMYSKQELWELAKILLERKIWVLSDECYDQFYYGRKAQVSFASLSREAYQMTITLNSLSKSFSMTGWRIGYAAGDEKVIAAMGSLQSHVTSNPCSFAQIGAVTALLKSRPFTKWMREAFKKRRAVIVRELNRIKGIKALPPDGAFYVFADISAIEKDSLKFAKELLEEAKVAVIPGAPFGADGYIRLSFAASEEAIKEGVKRINNFVREKYGKKSRKTE